jgi:hypothetical protein
LEKAVDQLLKRAQREEDLQKTEELKINHLSAEEVTSRRAEIMKTRELWSERFGCTATNTSIATVTISNPNINILTYEL